MADRQFVIPTVPGMGRGLVNHDERSKQYRAVDLIDRAKPRTHTWRRGAAYDQGQTSECVAYTGKGILNTQTLSKATPWWRRHRYNPDVFYAGAQAADEFPGEAYDGTSALGLCRYLASVGLIHSYHWAFGLNEALLALSWLGPVGIGIQWHEDMEENDVNGYIHPTGDVVGGHEIELTGIDTLLERVTLTNSWGTGWGLNGRAFLTFKDLGKLLEDNGDCVVITA
jgi:hypothetical protein